MTQHCLQKRHLNSLNTDNHGSFLRGLSQYCCRTPSKMLICEDIELKLELGIPGVSNSLELIQKASFENNLLHKNVD